MDELPEAPVSGAWHTCDRCGKPATHCHREGSGTGHSEHVCACEDHAPGLDEMPGLGIFFR